MGSRAVVHQRVTMLDPWALLAYVPLHWLLFTIFIVLAVHYAIKVGVFNPRKLVLPGTFSSILGGTATKAPLVLWQQKLHD